jgi:hypothetical protein
MMFHADVRLGKEPAPSVPAGNRNIRPNSVRNIGDYAGSYHILDMGGHFVDYMESPRTVMLAARLNPGFPQGFRYTPLLEKSGDLGVTGNLGEAIAAIAGRRCLGRALDELVHISRTGHNRAPDYVFRFGTLPTCFTQVCQAANLPAALLTAAPLWWPVEAKSRGGNGGKAGFPEGLVQLFAYWRECLRAGHAIGTVGYGLIVSTLYGFNPGQIRIHLILPRSQQRLSAYLTRNLAIDDSAFIRRLLRKRKSAALTRAGIIAARSLYGCR